MPKSNAQAIRELKLQEIEREEEQLLAELELYLREEEYLQAENNLYSFYKSAWERFDPTPFKDSAYLECLCEHAQAAVERKIRRLIVNVPPRSSKSSIFSVALPSYSWLKHPEEKFITASYSEKLATQMAVQSRQLMMHPWYKSRWIGDRKTFSMRADSNTKTRIDNDKFGYRISTSVGGLGTGTGYSIAVIDDPLNALDANSKAKRDEVINWYKGTLKNRANDPNSDVLIIVAQRLHQEDLCGYLLEEEKDLWFHLNMPLEFEKKYTFISPINFSDPRKQEGDLLDPNRFSETFVESQKRDIYKYATLYQQRPAPPEGGLIKKHWLQFYSEHQSLDFDNYVMSFDLSMVDSTTADYTVGTVWARRGGAYYLIDMVREKMDIVKQLTAIRAMKDKHPECRTILIEAKANGEAVMGMLRHQISGIIGIEPKDFGGGKEARLAACVPEFASHSVYFPQANEKPWVKEIVEELATFPNSKHDDIVDSISQAINWMALNQKQLSLPLAEAIEGQSTLGGIRDVWRKEDSYRGIRNDNANSIRGIFG